MAEEQDTQAGAKKKPFVGDVNAIKKMLAIARQAETNQFKEESVELMKPLIDKAGIPKEDQDFLDLILDKTGSGEIDLFVPETLLNHGVYDGLAEEQRIQIDTYTVGMLATIRRIKDLHDMQGFDEKMTYQMGNLIKDFRIKKETVEEKFGDVFVI